MKDRHCPRSDITAGRGLSVWSSSAVGASVRMRMNATCARSELTVTGVTGGRLEDEALALGEGRNGLGRVEVGGEIVPSPPPPRPVSGLADEALT